MDEAGGFWAPRDSFFPVFPELDAALEDVAEAADAVLASDLERARDRVHRANVPLLRRVAMRAMGALDHDLHRVRRVPMPPKSEKVGIRMPGRAVTDQVFARDGWHCRFCGVRLVVPAARKALANAVAEALCWSGPAESLHAAFVYVSATLDHIVPHSRGGTNDPDNLAATCWPCNFGRGGYLLEEMGLRDPRERAPIQDGWDGLTRLLRHPVPTQPRQKEDAPMAAARSPRMPRVPAPEWLAMVEGISEDVPDRMLGFLASCEGLPVSWSARDVLLLKMTVGGRTLDVFGFERSGAVQIPWWIGDAKPAFRNFAHAVASVISGAFAYETPKTWTVRHLEKRPVHVEELLESAKAVRDALAQLEEDLKAMDPVPDRSNDRADAGPAS